jgi:hypothetical protein
LHPLERAIIRLAAPATLAPDFSMRIAIVLVLLLAVSARPVRAQDTRLPPPLQPLPASLTPAASTASAPLDLHPRRNRGLGVLIGAMVGGAGSFLLAVAITGEESGEAMPVYFMVAGVGAVVGAVAGAIISH